MKATQAVSPRATFLRVSEKSSSFPHHASRDLVPFLSAGRNRLAQYRRFYPSYLGENQTIRYIDDLEACCQMLADNPVLGLVSDDIRPGLRRMEHDRHVVVYREAAGDIHQRMLPQTEHR